MAQDSNLRICHIDLFNVRSKEHFYSLLAQKVIAATSTKWEEAIESAKSFFSHLVPKISIGTDPTGNLMFLNKIETPCLVEFFKSRFADTGKNIDDEVSHLIAKFVDNHPYYAQQLAQLSWLRTKDVCTVEIVREAHTALVEQLSLLFVTITETLTTQQLNYLKALIAGEKAISSTEVIHRYQISSTTSISRSKAALIKNEYWKMRLVKSRFRTQSIPIK